MPPQAPRESTPEEVITAIAKREGVDPRLALSVAEVESGLRGWDVPDSSAGAIGVMQLMPATAARHRRDPRDRMQNIEAGILELKALTQAHKGDWKMVFRRYNGSPQAPVEATDPYVAKAMAAFRRRAGLPPAAPGEDTDGRLPQAAARQPRGGGASWTPQPPQSFPAYLADTAQKGATWLAETYDPRGAEGRQNIAGTIGGIGASGLTYAATRNPLWAKAAGVAGAGTLGALEQQLEEAGLFGAPPKPPADSTALGRTAGAFGEQAAGEAAGEAINAVAKKGVKLATQSRVGKAAAGALATGKERAVATMAAELQALQARLRELGVDRARVGRATTRETRAKTQAVGHWTRGVTGRVAAQGAESLERAKAAADALLGRAEETGAQGVTRAEEAGATQLADFAETHDPRHIPLVEAPSGQRVLDVLAPQGPATASKRAYGEAIDEAAQSGPTITIADLKQEAERLLQDEILPATRGFPPRTPTPGAPPHPSVAFDPTDPLGQLTTRVTEAQTEELARHPVLPLLLRIRRAANAVPFFEAHRMKQELQEAIAARGGYDSVTSSKVQGMTKHLASLLREKLAVHEPYNAATRAYAEVVPTFEEGFAQAIKDATHSPEKIVQMINVDDPSSVRRIVELLTTHATRGEALGVAGGRQMGQEALEAVQRSWMRRNLYDGPVSQLGDRLAQLRRRPEFVEAFLQTPSARQALNNLDQVAAANARLVADIEAQVSGARAAGVAGEAAAKQLGEVSTREVADVAKGARDAAAARGRELTTGMREAGDVVRERVRRETEDLKLKKRAEIDAHRAAMRDRARSAGSSAEEIEERAFKASTLANVREPIGTFADVFNIARMTSGVWAGTSWGRLLWGATDRDMLRYLGHSDALTQLFVRATHEPWFAKLVTAGVTRPVASHVIAPPPPPPGQARPATAH